MYAFTIGSRRETVGLCKEHYTYMCAHLHPVLHCASCGAKPRHRERFNRHCPCPSTVNHCLTKISKRPKKHLKNEQRSKDAAAKKRPNTSGVGKINNYYEDIYIPPYNNTD